MRRFQKFTHQQFESLIGHLHEYGLSEDSETLHQVRVDIKKIKAVLGVIHDTHKQFKAHRNFLYFRNIFRRAGTIREPDVLVQLLLEYQVEGIKDEQIAGNKLLAAAFKADVPYFISIVKKRAAKLENLASQVRSSEFKHYVRKKKKELKVQLNPRPRMNTLHETRKDVKEVIYLSDVEGKLKGKEGKFYTRIENTIGKLHDKQVLLELLKNRGDESYDLPRETIKFACRSDKKKIIHLVRKFYQ